MGITMLEQNEGRRHRFREGLKDFERQNEDQRRMAYFKYLRAIRKKEERRFVDITHDPLGRICVLYHNLRDGKPEYEPVEKKVE